jgi:hypothetical protein
MKYLAPLLILALLLSACGEGSKLMHMFAGDSGAKAGYQCERIKPAYFSCVADTGTNTQGSPTSACVPTYRCLDFDWIIKYDGEPAYTYCGRDPEGAFKESCK